MFRLCSESFGPWLRAPPSAGSCPMRTPFPGSPIGHPLRAPNAGLRRVLVPALAVAIALSGMAGTAAFGTTMPNAALAQTTNPARAADPGSYVTTRPGPGAFPLLERGTAAPIVVSSSDYAGVVRVVDDLQGDLESVGGVR